jgi:DNA repair protein RadC
MTNLSTADESTAVDLQQRMMQFGAGILSDTELLALILAGTAANGQTLHLAHECLTYLTRNRQPIAPILPAIETTLPASDTTIRMLALDELTHRLSANRPSSHPYIDHAAAALPLLQDMADLKQEHVRVILLDSARRVMSVSTISIGTVSAAMLRAAEVFREPILHNCNAIMLAHNHPSGSPTPSPEDVEITRGIAAAGRLLDITLLDHLIIGRDGWASLREMGLLRAD